MVLNIIDSFKNYQIDQINASYVLIYLLSITFISNNPFVYGFILKFGILSFAGLFLLHISLASFLTNIKDLIVYPNQIKSILTLSTFIFIGYELNLRYKDSIFNPKFRKNNITPKGVNFLKIIDLIDLMIKLIEVYLVLSGKLMSVMFSPAILTIWYYVHIFFLAIRGGITNNFMKPEYQKIDNKQFLEMIVSLIGSGCTVGNTEGTLLDFLKGIEIPNDPNHRYYACFYFYCRILVFRIMHLTVSIYSPAFQRIFKRFTPNVNNSKNDTTTKTDLEKFELKFDNV